MLKRCFLAVTALALGLTTNAFALRIALPPAATNNPTSAEMIIVGKVLEIEKDTVEGPMDGNPDVKVTYKIAVIKISDPIKGAKGLTQVRVGFVENNVGGGNGGEIQILPAQPGLIQVRPAIGIARPLPGRGGAPSTTFAKDQEGLVLLKSLPKAEFYIPVGWGAFVMKKDPQYDTVLKNITSTLEVMADPAKFLKSKELAERANAAKILLNDYRNTPFEQGKVRKEVPVDKEISALIVNVLAELPWTPENNDYSKPCRSQLWYMINPNKFGFVQPQIKVVPGQPRPNFNVMMEEATTKFLKENKEKIVVEKVVFTDK
ncbi:MAG: hypothetical protein R3B84_01915 [Zavarzinella sp.]